MRACADDEGSGRGRLRRADGAQLLLMQPEFGEKRKIGMYAGQAFVERTLAPALCKQAAN